MYTLNEVKIKPKCLSYSEALHEVGISSRDLGLYTKATLLLDKEIQE